MPYREPARPLPLRSFAPCVRCAAPVGAPVPAVDAEARCEACGVVQPVLATSRDLVRNTLRFVSLKSAGYEELATFAAEIGAPGPTKAVQVTFTCDGLRMEASLSLNSGTVMGLDLVAFTTGLPAMRLLPEHDRQREAKASGLSREIQLGDTSFDEAVYLETAATADAVRHTFAAPAVRAAVQELLGTVDAITVDGTAVRLYAAKNVAPFAGDRLRALVFALRAVAGAPRLLEIRYEAEPRAATWLKRATYLLAPAGLAAQVVGFVWYEPLDEWGAVFIPGAFALVLALGASPLLRRLLRGRSTSHRICSLFASSSPCACRCSSRAPRSC